MKITLKDYDTNETVLTARVKLIEVCGRGVFVCANGPYTFEDEVEQALYAVNNDVHSGVIADNYGDAYEPINPYMSWVFED
jgi:hypothetical protein